MGKRLKEPLLIVAFLLAGLCLHAQDEPILAGDGIFADGTDFPDFTGEPPNYTPDGKEQDAPQESETPEAPKKREREPLFPIKNRKWEMSIANIGFDFSNNFIAAADAIRNPFYMLINIDDVVEKPGLIWRDPVVINLDHFFGGFKFNFGANIKLFSFKYNQKDQWGFGLDIGHLDVSGNMSLSGNLVTISEADQDKFGMGGAVFVEAVGIPIFFHYNDIKIKIRPAVYAPLIYVEPNVKYTYTTITKMVDGEKVEGVLYNIDYDMRFYTIIDVRSEAVNNIQDEAWDIPKNNLGYDFGLSVEYPWLYNLDIGVDVVNIPVPFATARLNHYLELNDSVWVDTTELNTADLVGDDAKDAEDLKGKAFGYPDELLLEYNYDDEGKPIYRPFAMVFYANYRPLESRFLTLIPSLGFSINYLYPEIAAIEGGLSARFDTKNMFITTIGVNYNDRRWKNSIDFIFNFRFAEFDLGISFQSQDFVRSWEGAGLSIDLGMKFGW